MGAGNSFSMSSSVPAEETTKSNLINRRASMDSIFGIRHYNNKVVPIKSISFSGPTMQDMAASYRSKTSSLKMIVRNLNTRKAF